MYYWILILLQAFVLGGKNWAYFTLCIMIFAAILKFTIRLIEKG